MDDVLTCHSRPYDKADDLKKPKLWKLAFAITKELPLLILKLLFLGLALIFELLEQMFFWICPRPLRNIRGQLAAVTGGGNGIGREICLELARCGCNIACLDLDLDAAKQLCIELKQLGVQANAYKVDVADPENVKEVRRQINADLGVVDILVNNAGLMPKQSIRNSNAETIRRMMDVNVLAHFWTTQTFIEDMIAKRSGYIVGIASIIAFYPVSTLIPYNTSKYAVRGFMDTLTRESRHENWGVKTLTVFPHMTNTRREIMDYVRQKLSPSQFDLLQCRKPIDIAKATVRAIRCDAGYVSSPSFLLFFGKFNQFLPLRIQNLFDKLCMPRITADSGVQATKSDITV